MMTISTMPSSSPIARLAKAPIKGIPASRHLPPGCKTADDVPWPYAVPLPDFDEFCIGQLTKRGKHMENHTRAASVTVQHCLLGWIDATFTMSGRSALDKTSCIQHMRQVAKGAVMEAIRATGSAHGLSIAGYNDRHLNEEAPNINHKRKLARVWKKSMALLGYVVVEEKKW